MEEGSSDESTVDEESALICRNRRSSAASESPIGAEDLFDMSSASSRMAAPGMSSGATCSWLSPGLEIVEGLRGLSEGVGDSAT